MRDIFELATERMKPEEIDHHEGNLHLKINAESEDMVYVYEEYHIVNIFKNKKDNNEWWYDIPSAYNPYWDKIAE